MARKKKQKVKTPPGAHIREADLVRLLGFVEFFWADHGHAPTMREIAEGLSLTSPSVAWYWVQGAKGKGLVTSTGRQRSLQLTFRGRKLFLDGVDDPCEQLKARIEMHNIAIRSLEKQLEEL